MLENKSYNTEIGKFNIVEQKKSQKRDLLKINSFLFSSVKFLVFKKICSIYTLNLIALRKGTDSFFCILNLQYGNRKYRETFRVTQVIEACHYNKFTLVYSDFFLLFFSLQHPCGAFGCYHTGRSQLTEEERSSRSASCLIISLCLFLCSCGMFFLGWSVCNN